MEIKRNKVKRFIDEMNKHYEQKEMNKHYEQNEIPL